VRRTLTAGVAYLVAACAFTWPLVIHPRSLFAALDPGGDPSLNLWALAWDLKTISVHPSWLLTGRVFEAPIFHPAHHALAYADHFLPQAVALWPLYALTGDPVLCYNTLFLLSLVACALAMHVLVRALVDSEPAAFVAGLIFGFAPYHFTQLTHIQMQALYFLPLALLCVHRIFARANAIDALAGGAAAGLQAASAIYYGIIGGLGLVCAAIVLAIGTRPLHIRRLIVSGLLASIVALAIALPWSLPYLRVAREASAGRNLFEASQGSAVLASYVQAPPTNVAYGRSGWLTPSPDARLRRKRGPEQALFMGFCAMALALLGAVAAPRSLRAVVAVYATLTIAGVVLSLGPDGVRPLYAALYNGVFGMGAIRASARFSVLALCGVSVLAAIGVHVVELRATRARTFVVVAAIAAICLEFSNGAIAYPVAPALTSDAARWLRDQPGNGAVVCVPMGFDTGNTRCMLESIEHGRPIVNGQAGARPAFFAALVDAASRLPSSGALAVLHDVGVEFVVADGPDGLNVIPGGPLVERARFADRRVYQIVWSAEADAALDADVVPPEPGSAPFHVGESATYHVHWTSGPMNLPAGEATIAVVPPHGREAFRFEASAVTASWVSRFFQADAKLETTANDRLLPIVHREIVADGQRRIERDFAFDPAHRQVTMTTGGASIALSLAKDARDPISALYFVRTLPLRPGEVISLPLSDNGRRSRLDVTVNGRETIEIDGQPRAAWRVAPRISERVERQTPAAITAWLSDDPLRIPLRIEVTAAFGSVRVELASYRER